MGIRLALGAGRGTVVRLMMMQGMRLVAMGVGIGLLAAMGLSRLVESMLFDVPSADPITFVTIAGGLLLFALLATYLPSRRLTALDPATALRAE